jgi:hypothetical protein
LFLGPGFNCLWTGYWYHYNLLPPEVRERVDRYIHYFFDEHKYNGTATKKKNPATSHFSSSRGEEQIKIKMKYGGWGILR